MRGTDSEFEREDALVCADVLGGFGVSSDHVRGHVGGVADADAEDLESAIQRALADPEHPTAFVRRIVAAAPRGVDAPVRFWTTAPETQLGDVFAALDWTFDVKSANGRSLSADDEQPYRLRVEDADGRARSTTFSFPETPLGDDNYPALVAAINEALLHGLSCRFVLLSDGTDRWRFALVETEALERLRERFGERLSVFDRPLLAPDQPDAYRPGPDSVASDDDEVPTPDWACDDGERSWRGRRVTADAFDADHVGGLDHLDGGGETTDPGESVDSTEDGGATDGDADGGVSDVIEFVGEDEGETAAGATGADATTGAESGTVVRGGSASTVVRDAEASGIDDADGWSIGGTVDATTRSSPDGTTTADDEASTDGISTDGFDWGSDLDAADDGSTGTPADNGSTGTLADDGGVDGQRGEEGGDGFFSADAAASFDAGAETSRVEADSFGVDAGEQTAADEFAAVGAAIAAPAGISVDGLLDDEEFLPQLPRAEPEQTRIEFEEGLDLGAVSSAQERETDDGFVWVNESGGVDEQRTSALD